MVIIGLITCEKCRTCIPIETVTSFSTSREAPSKLGTTQDTTYNIITTITTTDICGTLTKDTLIQIDKVLWPRCKDALLNINPSYIAKSLKYPAPNGIPTRAIAETKCKKGVLTSELGYSGLGNDSDYFLLSKGNQIQKIITASGPSTVEEPRVRKVYFYIQSGLYDAEKVAGIPDVVKSVNHLMSAHFGRYRYQYVGSEMIEYQSEADHLNSCTNGQCKTDSSRSRILSRLQPVIDFSINDADIIIICQAYSANEVIGKAIHTPKELILAGQAIFTHALHLAHELNHLSSSKLKHNDREKDDCNRYTIMRETNSHCNLMIKLEQALTSTFNIDFLPKVQVPLITFPRLQGECECPILTISGKQKIDDYFSVNDLSLEKIKQIDEVKLLSYTMELTNKNRRQAYLRDGVPKYIQYLEKSGMRNALGLTQTESHVFAKMILKGKLDLIDDNLRSAWKEKLYEKYPANRSDEFIRSLTEIDYLRSLYYTIID